MQDYNALPLDQLKTLHREIGALIAQRRHEALEQVKQQIAVLGFNVDDLIPKKRKETTPKTPKFRDADNPERTWSGRGKRPSWLQEKLAQGRSLEDFAIEVS
jgi:DNA-binding protein H-NS